MNNNKIIYFLLSCCVFIGTFFRFYNLRFNTQFTWDQENTVSFAAKQIVADHHFPLIGAKTGVGNLFLSPYYAYLIAPVYALFRLDPIAGALTAGIFSVLTMILGFILVRKITSTITAFYFVIFWAISPFILSTDRIPWNVNLLPISTILFFAGLWIILLNKNQFGWISIGCGILIGTTAHLSVFFFLILIVLFFILKEELRNKNSLIALFGLLIGLVPLIVFNFRHGNNLAYNFIKFSNESVFTNRSLGRFIQILSLQLESIGKVIISDSNNWLQICIAVLFIFSLYNLRTNKTVKLYSQVFLPLFFIYLLGFSLYSGAIPEYYFLGLDTIAVIGIAILFEKLARKYIKINILLFIFCIFSLFQSFQSIKKINPQSIGVKSEIVNSIRSNTNGNNFSIVYDMDLGWSFGYTYLLYYYGLEGQLKPNSNNTYWISYPVDRYPGNPDKVISQIGLGFPKSWKTILDTKDADFYGGLFSLRLPKKWIVTQCPSIDFDIYYISTQVGRISCDAKSSELEIRNFPDCNINLYSNESKILLNNGSELYTTTNTEHFKAYIFSLEKDRCVEFIDRFESNGEDDTFRKILETLRVKSK